MQATERLEVDDRTRGECFKALKNALKQEPLATHGLLFVGTKLLATYSKNKAPDIDPSDMLLLINDFRATFHPYGANATSHTTALLCLLSACCDWGHGSLTRNTRVYPEREVEETAIHTADYSQGPATLSTQESGYDPPLQTKSRTYPPLSCHMRHTSFVY
jgi:hypothetical protein